MNVQIRASDEYRIRWGRTTKRQNIGHPKRQARYDRAMARITEQRREAVTARAIKECGFPAMPKNIFDALKVEKLIAHKLGVYQPG